MQDENVNMIKIKAIILDVIVAAVIMFFAVSSIKLMFGKQIKAAIHILDMVSIDTNIATITEIKFDAESNEMLEKPSYGARYGNLKIDSIELNLPLYYGENASILKRGIGHFTNSYFPGEGGSILFTGNNTKAFLQNLPKTKEGDIIEVTTTYGTYKYKIYEKKVVNVDDENQAPINKNSEILMLYTNFPIENLGNKNERYYVCAKRIYTKK